MKAIWSRWVSWWSALPSRQQWLVLGALVMLGLGAIDSLLLAPAQKAERALRGKLVEQTATRTRLKAEGLAARAEQARLRTEEAALQKRLRAAEARIAEAKANLSGPAVLRQRIRALSQDSGVRLVSLASQPVETLEVGNSPGQGGAKLYRIPLTATLEGPYAALLAHLQQLEKSPQGLAWQRIKLDNSTWPAVRMEIKLFMLSDQPQWRGE